MGDLVTLDCMIAWPFPDSFALSISVSHMRGGGGALSRIKKNILLNVGVVNEVVRIPWCQVSRTAAAASTWPLKRNVIEMLPFQVFAWSRTLSREPNCFN